MNEINHSKPANEFVRWGELNEILFNIKKNDQSLAGDSDGDGDFIPENVYPIADGNGGFTESALKGDGQTKGILFGEARIASKGFHISPDSTYENVGIGGNQYSIYVGSCVTDGLGGSKNVVFKNIDGNLYTGTDLIIDMGKSLNGGFNSELKPSVYYINIEALGIASEKYSSGGFDYWEQIFVKSRKAIATNKSTSVAAISGVITNIGELTSQGLLIDTYIPADSFGAGVPEVKFGLYGAINKLGVKESGSTFGTITDATVIIGGGGGFTNLRYKGELYRGLTFPISLLNNSSAHWTVKVEVLKVSAPFEV